jgi:hypothetical protein
VTYLTALAPKLASDLCRCHVLYGIQALHSSKHLVAFGAVQSVRFHKLEKRARVRKGLTTAAGSAGNSSCIAGLGLLELAVFVDLSAASFRVR